MDIEFHYYITWIIAERAGFAQQDAAVIAYASQYVDDNTEVFVITQKNGEYRNSVSQTVDILKPAQELMQIYPAFHFMPGTRTEIDTDGTLRRDGRFHVLNTAPGNSNALRLFRDALATRDLYRIGIAAHMFSDTFAHQNFVGYYEQFNAMQGPFDNAVPNVGHADAGHDPDLPALVWEDTRLIRRNATVNNKERLLAAAGSMFEKLRRYLDPQCTAEQCSQGRDALLSDLDHAIGETGDRAQNDRLRTGRIARYRKLIGKGFKEYGAEEWLNKAVRRELLASVNPFAAATWRRNHEQSHWFLFQEAVKGHQQHACEAVLDKLTEGLELEGVGGTGSAT